MRATLYLAAKDLRQRLRDRSALIVAVAAPLVLAFVFNLVFGSGATPRPFRFAVVDLDGGPVAQAFTTGVLDQLAAQDILTTRRVETADQAGRLAEAGTIDAAFVLPSGLSAAVQTGAEARVDVIGSVQAPTGSEVARSVAQSFVTNLNGVRVAAVAAVGSPSVASAEQLTAAATRAAALSPPLRMTDVSAGRKLLDIKTYFAAAMAIFFVFFTVQFGVSSLIDERAAGTLNRLLAMPLRPGVILGGKLLTSVVLGVTSMTVLVVATSTLMGASWGDPAAVALLVLAAVLAATGVTAFVASLARTAEQAGSWQAVISTLLGLLGGVFFPIAQVGGVAKAVSLTTPHAWFLRGLGELATGGGIVAALPAVGAMLAFAAVTGAVAFLRLRKVLRP